MPVEFEDVEFRDVAETEGHLGVCSDDPEKPARDSRASAAGPAPILSQLMNTAPVRDTVPDVSSSAAEPVTAVKHTDDDDDDDRPPDEVLPSNSPHILKPSHSAPDHAYQPNADSVADFPFLRSRSKLQDPDHASQPNANSVADFPFLRSRSKRQDPDEDDDNSVD
jgi:hypothetical protein